MQDEGASGIPDTAFSLFSSLDASSIPIPKLEYQYEDHEYLCAFIDKNIVKIGDKIEFYIFLSDQCLYHVQIDVESECPTPYILTRLIPIPYLVTLDNIQRNLYLGMVGLAVNGEQASAKKFKIKRSVTLYTPKGPNRWY
jgi:hypothetical protein